jgi:hypothetical protein
LKVAIVQTSKSSTKKLSNSHASAPDRDPQTKIERVFAPAVGCASRCQPGFGGWFLQSDSPARHLSWVRFVRAQVTRSPDRETANNYRFPDLAFSGSKVPENRETGFLQIEQHPRRFVLSRKFRQRPHCHGMTVANF